MHKHKHRGDEWSLLTQTRVLKCIHIVQSTWYMADGHGHRFRFWHQFLTFMRWKKVIAVMCETKCEYLPHT